MTTTFKILAVSAMVAFTTSAFSQSSSKMLLGKWKVQELTAEYPKTMSSADKFKADQDLDEFAKRFKSSPFIFGKDSALFVMGKDARWALEKDDLHIRFILMKDEEILATIISLKPNKLKFYVIDHDTKQFFTLVKHNEK